MWKISTILVVTFVSFCDASESNASWSGSEASEDFDANCEEVGTYRRLNGGEYKFVASVEEFEDAERGVLIHKCLAIIISSWNAISSAYCGERWHRKNSKNEGQLYVSFQRNPPTKIDKKYLIKRFKPMDDKIALITLAKEITFLSETDLPIYQEEPSGHVDSMIGWNRYVFANPARHRRPYVKYSISVTNPLRCEGKLGPFQFCVKAVIPNQLIETTDLGAPLFDNNELVGLVIKTYYKYVIAVLISRSQIDRYIGLVARKRSSVAKSSTGSKYRQMRRHSRKKNSS